MIDAVLGCIEDDINNYLRLKLPNSLQGEKKVLVSNIVNQDGTIAVNGSDKVILSLYNIEHESAPRKTGGASGGIKSGNNGALFLNIYILFVAYFSSNNYSQGLMFISYIISYFHKKNNYNSSNTPKFSQLGIGVDKILFEINTLSPEQVNNLWSTVGAKMMPFVMYKVRTLQFDESVLSEYRPAISGISTN